MFLLQIVDEDMQMKSDALESVKEAANELIRQAGDATDPAVKGRSACLIESGHNFIGLDSFIGSRCR